MSSIPNSTRAASRQRRGAPPLWLIYTLLFCPVGFLIVFNYIPAGSAIYHAFTRWDPGTASEFNGLSNFIELFQDPIFRQSLMNLVKLGGFVFLVNMTVPFIIAGQLEIHFPLFL